MRHQWHRWPFAWEFLLGWHGNVGQQPAFFFFISRGLALAMGIFVVMPNRGRSKQYHCYQTNNKKLGRTVAFRTYLSLISMVCVHCRREARSLYIAVLYVVSSRKTEVTAACHNRCVDPVVELPVLAQLACPAESDPAMSRQQKSNSTDHNIL